METWEDAEDAQVLVTGGLGCIGSWAVRALLRSGARVHILDRASDRRRLRLVLDPKDRKRAGLIQGDLTEPGTVERAIEASGATRILHLAALQVPACRSDPPQGAAVNVVGTARVFEAAAAAELERVAYASSVAVYGPADRYPDPPVTPNVSLDPQTEYGVYKQANEGLAARYHAHRNLPSTGLRPYVVYGPGRDRGMTSHPTKAMLAAVLGEDYHIPFGGAAEYHHGRDVGALFARAALSDRDGATVHNLGACSYQMDEIVAAIEEVRPRIRGRISFTRSALPFPPALSDETLQDTLGPYTYTSIEEGVRATVDHFERAVEEDLVGREMLG
jgi:nucleoside-diphosphate-sugar epimerase